MKTPPVPQSLLAKGDLINYTPEILGVTQSMLNTWFDCEKKARYYSRGLTPTGGGLSPALIFGSMFHDFQEFILSDIKEGKYKNFSDYEKSIPSLNADVWECKWSYTFKHADAKTKDNINYAWEYVTRLIPIYFSHYKSDFSSKWLEVEKELMHSIHDIPFRGKMDGIVQYSDGKKYLMEHKTKSRVDTEGIQKMLGYNFQVLVYIALYFLQTGNMLDGVVYNVCRKTSLRKKAAESTHTFMTRCMDDMKSRKDWYFMRFVKIIPSEDVERFADVLYHKVLQFKNWAHMDEALDLRNTNKCQGLYGACQYIDYCSSNEQDHATLDIKEKLFSELS